MLILSTGTFTLGVDGFVLSGLLQQVAVSLHVSASTAGQLTTLFALVYAAGSPVIAAVAGGWDRRTLLSAGMAVFIVGMIVQATGPDFAAVAAGRVLAALGAAGYQATAYSTAGILSDDTHRAHLAGCPQFGDHGRADEARGSRDERRMTATSGVAGLSYFHAIVQEVMRPNLPILE